MAWFQTKRQSADTIQVTFQLPVSFIEEDGAVIAYTPALDLSTSGKSKKEAQKMFEEAVDIFFKDLIENNTVEEVLTSLNWKRNEQRTWVPPKISQESIGVRVPAFA